MEIVEQVRGRLQALKLKRSSVQVNALRGLDGNITARLQFMFAFYIA